MAAAGRMELCRKTLGRIRDELVLATRAANFQPWGLVVVYQSYRAPKASLNTIATLKKGVLSQRHNLSAGILSKPLDSSESVTAWRSTGGNYHLFIRYPQPAIDEGNKPFTPNFAIKNTWQKFIQSVCEPLEDCANSLELPSLEIIPEDRLESNSWISWLFALGAMDDPIPGHRIDPKFIWYSGGQPVLGGSADHVLNQVNMAVEIPLDLSKWRAEVELAEWDQERQIAVIPNRKDHSGEPYQVPMSWFSHIEDVHRASIACIDWMLTQIPETPTKFSSTISNMLMPTKNRHIPEVAEKTLRRAQDQLQEFIKDGFNPEVVCVHAYKPLYEFIYQYDIHLPLNFASLEIEGKNRSGGWPHGLWIPPVGMAIPEDYESRFSARVGVLLRSEFYRRYASSFQGRHVEPSQNSFERLYFEYYPEQNHAEFSSRWAACRSSLLKTLGGIRIEDWPTLWEGTPHNLLREGILLDGWFDLVFQLATKNIKGCSVRLNYQIPLDERLDRLTNWSSSKRPFQWDDPNPFCGWEFRIENFTDASIGAIDWLIANWPGDTEEKTSETGGSVAVGFEERVPQSETTSPKPEPWEKLKPIAAKANEPGTPLNHELLAKCIVEHEGKPVSHKTVEDALKDCGKETSVSVVIGKLNDHLKENGIAGCWVCSDGKKNIVVSTNPKPRKKRRSTSMASGIKKDFRAIEKNN